MGNLEQLNQKSVSGHGLGTEISPGKVDYQKLAEVVRDLVGFKLDDSLPLAALFVSNSRPGLAIRRLRPAEWEALITQATGQERGLLMRALGTAITRGYYSTVGEIRACNGSFKYMPSLGKSGEAILGGMFTKLPLSESLSEYTST